MTFTDRNSGRKYQIVKVFTNGKATHMEARTGRRYNLIKRYV